MTRVHPAAEHNPMLSDEALDRLAADIKANDLREPITFTPDGQLLDGRNRAEACRRLGIEPAAVVYAGEPWAFVMSKNIERRHVSTGSRAATVALMLKDQGKRQRGRWQRGSVPEGNGDNPNSCSTDSGWIEAMRRAGLVLDWAPELLEGVINEKVSLDAAFHAADKSRQADLLAKEQERKRRERELAQADAALADFLTHVSHLLQLKVELICESTDTGGWKDIAKHLPVIRQMFDRLEKEADVRLG
jgi:hypothetical protein